MNTEEKSLALIKVPDGFLDFLDFVIGISTAYIVSVFIGVIFGELLGFLRGGEAVIATMLVIKLIVNRSRLINATGCGAGYGTVLGLIFGLFSSLVFGIYLMLGGLVPLIVAFVLKMIVDPDIGRWILKSPKRPTQL